MTRNIALFGTAVALAAITGAAAAQDAEGTWTADLTSLNAEAAGGEAAGTAVITVVGDMATLQLDATGTPPDIMHLQHIHGFAEGDAVSECPTADADSNGDGVIDVVETEQAAGTTMVPLDADPAAMDLLGDQFPTADASGAYSYSNNLSLSALTSAFEAQFPGQQLDLDRRVIFVHGVPEGASLPDSAQSVGDAPAHKTLPIACGQLRKSET